MTDAQLVILALCIPVVGTVFIGLFARQPNARESVTLVTAGGLFVTVLAILVEVMAGGRPVVSGLEVLPGLSLSFAVEPLGMLFALIASGLWIVNSIYSIGYMRANDEPRQTPFYMCFAIAIASTLGIAFAENLFTLFIFYEVLTLSTYPLVTHKGNGDAIRGGRVYLLLLLGTSMVLFLPAIIWTWVLTGTLDFTTGGILAGKAEGPVVGILLAMFVFGIGKAAMMPFHRWLPAAMVAPTPVSALLHAVAVVKAGVFTVLKVIVYIFGIDLLRDTGSAQWLLYAAGFTMLTASVIALRQQNLKKMLAYSTVSQLSYVILAAALFTPISAVAAAMHIAAHAVSKITLFFAAGSIYTAAHFTEINQLNGIGRRMPWTMGAFSIGAISMIGLPPTAGFLGKWFIFVGGMDTGAWFAVAILVISTLLNAGYFLPVIIRAFLCEPDEGQGHHAHGEAPVPILIALTFTAALTVLMFLFPSTPLALARAMIGGV